MVLQQKSSVRLWGWAAPGEKITIKEYALHKIADTPIMAGEK